MIGFDFSCPALAVNRWTSGLVAHKDFTRGSLPPGVTLSRASQGSFLSATGVPTLAAANAPRFDHDAAGASLGLLVEAGTTNLQGNQVFSSTGANGMTRQSVSATGIFPSACQFTSLAGSSVHYCYIDPAYSIGFTSGQTYALSFWFSTTAEFAVVTGGSTAFGTNQWLVVNTLSGAIVHARNCTGSLRAFAGGWRVTMTVAATATATGSLAISLSDGSDARFPVFSTTHGLTVFGAQVETGSSGTSYIPTSGAATARAPDIAGLTGLSGVFDLRLTYGDGSRQTLLAQSIGPGWWPATTSPRLRQMSIYKQGRLYVAEG